MPGAERVGQHAQHDIFAIWHAHLNALLTDSVERGLRDIDAAARANAIFTSPSMIACAADMTACRPEPAQPVDVHGGRNCGDAGPNRGNTSH